jgi:hypothetical protein
MWPDSCRPSDEPFLAMIEATAVHPTSKSKMPPRIPSDEIFRKILRRSTNRTQAQITGMVIKYEQLSWERDNRTRAVRGFAKIKDDTAIQPANNHHGFARAALLILDPVVSILAIANYSLPTAI